MAPLEPGYFPRWPLGIEDEVDRWPQPRFGIRAGAQSRGLHGSLGHHAGLVKYKMMLLPINGLSNPSIARVSHGLFIKSHTSNR